MRLELPWKGTRGIFVSPQHHLHDKVNGGVSDGWWQRPAVSPNVYQLLLATLTPPQTLSSSILRPNCQERPVSQAAWSHL